MVVDISKLKSPGDIGFTKAEIHALNLTIELVNVMAQGVIGNGPSRDGDITELVAHIHPIQHMIMSQVAARAYPQQFRLLGGVLADGASRPSPEQNGQAGA